VFLVSQLSIPLLSPFGETVYHLPMYTFILALA
jgi:hypothetical protein